LQNVRNGVRIFVMFGECKEWSAIENNHSITTLKKICFFPIFLFSRRICLFVTKFVVGFSLFLPQNGSKSGIFGILKKYYTIIANFC